jgi:hypothetical protein
VRTLSPSWRRVLTGSWVMIAVLSVTTLILYVDNKRTRDCISTYMVKDQETAKLRFQLADQERQAFKLTLQVLVSGESDPTKRQRAITDYIDLLTKNDRVREDNPSPPVPTECS